MGHFLQWIIDLLRRLVKARNVLFDCLISFQCQKSEEQESIFHLPGCLSAGELSIISTGIVQLFFTRDMEISGGKLLATVLEFC